jgi:hypothetical protein
MRANGGNPPLAPQAPEIAGKIGRRRRAARRSRWLRRRARQGRPGAGRGREAQPVRRVGAPASAVGGGARGGGLRAVAALALAALASGCSVLQRERPARGVEVVKGPEAGRGVERDCAWYGDARDGVLYFGESAFWSAERAHANPLADRLVPGPRRIGRFDLAARRLEAPLDAGPGERLTGVWDVLAHPNGRVYFTTWFDSMGWVDARTGEVRTLDALGRALNEIAPGPDETLLVSRYGSGDGERGSGSVLIASLEGEPLAELPLLPPAGYRVGPKTVAYDPARDEIWVTTDLIPLGEGPTRHDAYVLDRSGREKRRVESREVQFVAFRRDGTGLLAEVEGSRLELRVRAPDAPDRLLLADAAFPTGLDFVQDIQFAPDGRAVVTRWSGTLHVFEPPDALATLRLPRIEPSGLYYSGVLADGRVCTTLCGGITVVCAPAHPVPVR